MPGELLYKYTSPDYEYLIAIRADKISISGEDGDIPNYIHNKKHTNYFYEEKPEEVSEIRNIGIFPSEELLN